MKRKRGVEGFNYQKGVATTQDKKKGKEKRIPVVARETISIRGDLQQKEGKFGMERVIQLGPAFRRKRTSTFLQ